MKKADRLPQIITSETLAFFLFSYGDKTPKFVFGRIFGVLWILTGLVVIAIFTATATSALSISASELSALEGAKVKRISTKAGNFIIAQSLSLVKQTLLTIRGWTQRGCHL